MGIRERSYFYISSFFNSCIPCIAAVLFFKYWISNRKISLWFCIIHTFDSNTLMNSMDVWARYVYEYFRILVIWISKYILRCMTLNFTLSSYL